MSTNHTYYLPQIQRSYGGMLAYRSQEESPASMLSLPLRQSSSPKALRELYPTEVMLMIVPHLLLELYGQSYLFGLSGEEEYNNLLQNKGHPTEPSLDIEPYQHSSGEEGYAQVLYLKGNLRSTLLPINVPLVLSEEQSLVATTLAHLESIHQAQKGVIQTPLLELIKQVNYNPATQQYLPRPGGEILGKLWSIHAENVISKLGSIDVKHLWLDVLNHYYTSGVTKADVLVLDVKHVTLDREQREWRVTYTIETTTKKKRSFGGSKKKSHSESYTVTLTESYPAHLSGLLAFKKLIGSHEDATAWFPERQEGREIESLNVYAATVISENEGWAPHVKEIIKFHPKVDTSLRYSETHCKDYSKRGMIAESKVVSPHVWLEGPLHPVCEGVIELVSLQITTSSPHVVFEAGELIHLQEQSVFQQEDFQYFKRGNKVYERSGWHEERTPITISMPGRPVFRSRGEIQGEVTEIQGCEKPCYEVPIINVTRPVLQQESYERVIGQISKGNQGIAMVAALAVGIASAGTATPAVMAAFLGEIGGTIASAMVASIASQTASSLVMHQGNLKQIGKDLTSSGFARSLIVTAATAVVMHELSGTLKLPTQPKGFEQHLKVNAIRSAVSSSLSRVSGRQSLRVFDCSGWDPVDGRRRMVTRGPTDHPPIAVDDHIFKVFLDRLQRHEQARDDC